ncbi:MAG: IS256 family transposase [bacterium]|nr:IS256 family transposase [bacterium]
MPIRKELLDELLKDCAKREDMVGPDGLLRKLTGALVERMLEAEMTEHLGYEKDDPAGRRSGNSRNGKSTKTLRTGRGDVPIEVPRDREGDFEPQVVKKGETHFEGFDDEIISMYGRGMTQRDIREHLEQMYGTKISPDLISRATAAVWDELQAWRNRPLDPVWPIVILDAIVLKVREKGTVANKSAYVALGVDLRGHREVLGIWLEQNEGAKLWLSVLTELKNRGVEDILIACCDGLKGFPEAIEAAFPKTVVQTCIVHMIRNSLRYANWKQRRAMAKALRPIYSADTREAAETELDRFETEWGERYPMVVKSWRDNWERVVPFLDFPPPIRKVIYTTNAIESLNATLRKVLTPRRHFPSDEAALKVMYLAIQNRERRSVKPMHTWSLALQHFSIHFEGRVPIN